MLHQENKHINLFIVVIYEILGSLPNFSTEFCVTSRAGNEGNAGRAFPTYVHKVAFSASMV